VTLPLATTTITVKRPAAGGDPYEAASVSTVVSGVRAHIGSPSGRERIVGGSKETLDAGLDCDVCDIAHTDSVTDATTGEVFEVVWVQRRVGLGLDHMEGGLRRVSGGSNG